MGVRRVCINIVKYALEGKIYKNKNNKTKNVVKSQFRKGIGVVFYLKEF